MNSNFSDFIAGFWGGYDFASDKLNILYGGLPNLSYILGQLVFIILAIGVGKTMVEKELAYIAVTTNNLWLMVKNIWLKSVYGKSKVILFSLVVLVVIVESVSKAVTTIAIYQNYSKEAVTSKQVTVTDISAQRGWSRYSTARIDATLSEVDGDGKTYSVHFINGDRRLMNQLKNQNQSSYEAVIYYSKDGKPLYINDFSSAKSEVF